MNSTERLKSIKEKQNEERVKNNDDLKNHVRIICNKYKCVCNNSLSSSLFKYCFACFSIYII